MVRALSTDNPLATSAATLRERLGHGSLSTYQRHLMTIRAATLKETELPDDAAMMAFATNPPMDLLESIWHRAAEGAAKALWQTLSRAQARIENLEHQTLAQAADLMAFETEIETLDAKAIDLQNNLFDAKEALHVAQADASKMQALTEFMQSELTVKLEKQAMESASATRELTLKLSWTAERLDVASSREAELKMQLAAEIVRVNDLLARIPTNEQ